MESFENLKNEKFSEQPRKCLEKKIEEIQKVLKDYPETIKEEEKKENLKKIIDQMEEEIGRLKPEQIKNNSHFGHILGQLQGRLGFAPRLRRFKELNDDKKIGECQQELDQAIGSIKDYFNLSLINKDYFYGEISDEQGYFQDKELEGTQQKISELNSDEFIALSQEMLEETEESQ